MTPGPYLSPDAKGAFSLGWLIGCVSGAVLGAVLVIAYLAAVGVL